MITSVDLGGIRWTRCETSLGGRTLPSFNTTAYNDCGSLGSRAADEYGVLQAEHQNNNPIAQLREDQTTTLPDLKRRGTTHGTNPIYVALPTDFHDILTAVSNGALQLGGFNETGFGFWQNAVNGLLICTSGQLVSQSCFSAPYKIILPLPSNFVAVAMIEFA